MPAADLPLPFALPPALPLLPPDRGPDAAVPHLILPYAAAENAPAVATPQLDALLAWLAEVRHDGAEYDFPIPPHERAVAEVFGLDARVPAWAAVDAPVDAAPHVPHAWLTPCHLHAGADQVRLDDPAQLQLTLADAQALCAILAPWWAEDGLTLQVLTPLLWRVSGAPLAGLRTASLDRVLLRDASLWLPQTQPFQRLHSEAQMLLYNHPFNDAREARGLPPVNGFWLHGAGVLTQAPTPASTPAQCAAPRHITFVDSLRQTALRQDWAAWQQAWQQADAGPVAALLAHVRAGGQATLTLCGEAQALHFKRARSALLQRFQGLFNRKTFNHVRNQL
ncbi:phosphoglycerate mutase [Comamonas nitrativorans]|uniref:Phosphoglycerate mutase n=1 Tax=Comamonas nitrativorans TaxID=108437 RepID=A0ABV9GUI7_9BURK